MSTTDEQQAVVEQGETRRLRVYRYKRGDGGEHFEEFDVPVIPHTILLDALSWIQHNCDRRWRCSTRACTPPAVLAASR